MVEAINIHKSFNGKLVISDISAIFQPGKINCTIGKSGSGKTVLLKIIIGLEVPDSGEIKYDNREFTGSKAKFKKEIRKEIGMVFQGGALFDSMTILENVIFPLDMFTDLSYDQKVEIAIQKLKRVGLTNIEKRFPSELSGGMQKRAAIARAIVNTPKYLFCDEPNSGLDPITAATIDDLIKDIVNEFKMTAIVNTHDMNSVLEIADKILFIHNGSKYWEGVPQEMLNSNLPEINDFLLPFKNFMKK